MKRSRQVIPNLFTTMNIFFGFLAIINASENNFVTASWFIVIAAIFDLFDGQVARLTKTASAFGVEFDSLADVISFGLAPAFLIQRAYLNSFGLLGTVISFLPLVCGGIRLARFNIHFGGKEKTEFVGLPIPFAAVSIVSFIIFNYYFWNEIYLERVVIPQIVLISILMLSKVGYYVLPKFSFRQGRKHSVTLILMIVSIVIVSLFPQATFYPFVMVYILWGIVRFFFKIFRSSDSDKTIEAF
ncbi:MAG: CDP-diacylglycerol--serine O-phosphatidyltransferase [Calditrichaeota bacterium]|nr:CDP-diacylglycerol--serine O-phosphatidyltransferase [Calditrichota bacterium]